MIIDVTHNDAPTAHIYTPTEVAAHLRCSRTHVYRLMASGILPAIDISVPGSKASKSRIRASDLNAYLDSIGMPHPDDVLVD